MSLIKHYIPGEHPIFELLNDMRFRRFECEQIEETYTATLTYYRGRNGRVTVPAIYDGFYIYELGPRLFNNNPWIRQVKIQNGIRTICDEAFEDCVRLKKLILPASIRTIEGQPFAGCQCLNEIMIDPHNESLQMQNGMLIDKKNGRLVFCINRRDETITIPEGVRVIASYAFMNCKQMHSIKLPQSLEKIGSCAFSGSGLREFPFP